MKKKTRCVFTIFEDPIRSEKFSEARLERHGESLARAQQVYLKTKRGVNLASRVKENEKVLFQAYTLMLESAREHREITPAAEWLINNFFIIEDQLKEIREHLPSEYYRELPKLSTGPLIGYPRVYGIAWAYVAHNESLFDSELLQRFIKSYQKVQPLTIGELWAIPSTLRIVMIENLRRLSARIVGSQIARKNADLVADELLGLLHVNNPKIPERTIDEIISVLRNSDDLLQPGFAVQLIQRLRFQDSKVAGVLKLLDERLEAVGLAADKIVSEEHSSQSVANATVRNIITSMRLISAYDWHEFFEEVSLVDELLHTDPLYAKMDFLTRDRYRHGLEELARGAKIAEMEVAQKVIKKGNLGHYLISSGRYEFEKELGFKITLRRRLLRFYISNGKLFYIGSIIALSMLLLFICFRFSGTSAESIFLTMLLFSVGSFPAFEIALSLVNRFTVDILGPWHIPRLKLLKGVPPHLKTFIVVPTMFINEGDIAKQVKQLEVHYLSNPDGFIYLALLSDWKDAVSEDLENDGPLLNSANIKIKELNERYGKGEDGKNRFYLFHRKRRWSESEQKWIGWERKRGKLHELNRLLRGASDTTFIISPEVKSEIPQDIRYVITLDADTKMPRDTVNQLVGTMAHPLNLPIFDIKLGRVVSGYGILQPRVTPFLPVPKDSTMFQRLFSGVCGIDSYSSAVSDVYQDLFGEGSYTGKGIYNIDIFEQAMGNRVPQDRLLSHDLFEGNFARCALLNDVEFFEDFPSHSQVALSRMHRWIRGDWQLLPWIFGREGRSISVLGRLKMVDNLRRSLTDPMTLFLLILVFFVDIPNAVPWIILSLASLGAVSLLSLTLKVFSCEKNFSISQKIRSTREDLSLGFGRIVFNLTMLPHQSLTYLDAIIRASYRLTISKRNLLEWTTAASSKTSANLSFKSFFLATLYLEVLLILAFLIILFFSSSIVAATPFIVLWLLSPLVAWQVSSLSGKKNLRPLEDSDVFLLRNTARRIWYFFSTYVTEKENFLPPDNIQEDEIRVIAHRSSPTNLGLYLLSVVAARDFSWIGLEEMVKRLENTLMSMKKLSRHNGHFYNWYQTTDLLPLEPRYISSVDNGNLAGHLLVIEQRLKELQTIDHFEARFPLDAFKDSFRLLRESIVTENESQISGIINSLEDLLALPFNKSKKNIILGYTNLLVDQTKKIDRNSEMHNWSILIQDEVWSHIADIDLFESPTGVEAFKLKVQNVIVICRQLFFEMDFSFLYNHRLKLFSIGYRVEGSTLDSSHYDLLASESRLLSFIAIAKGDVSSKHWFRLGRGLTIVESRAALISWSGSMFEYLMPSLVMETPIGSLLEQTCSLIVKKQILYGKEKSTPWGISESAYNERDRHFTYQYSDFGVPGLGLKRGLDDNLVIAPYATILAAMYDPISAVKNLRRLFFASGEFGYYDAVDFTKERLPKNEKYAVVKTYMAHHQGMSLVSIANTLYSGIFCKRFHLQPLVQATELLLQERILQSFALPNKKRENVFLEHQHSFDSDNIRSFDSPSQVIPCTNLLSNGTYAVMMTTSGSGHSRFRNLSVTRWREDVTLDNYGSYIYLRQLDPNKESRKIWSAGFQPTAVEADSYKVIFTEDRVKITRVDGEITTDLEVFVSPEDNAEIRRVTLTNNGQSDTEIEVTSYAEVVLNTNAADIAHSTFSNLFVQTEFVEEISSILATRRSRTLDEAAVWLAHVISTDFNVIGEIGYETDRSRFIGRGRDISNPVSIFDGTPLSNSVGAVLDPIISLRAKVRIRPGSAAKVIFSTAVASSKEEVLCLADKLRDGSTFMRVSNLAWTQAHITLHYLGIKQNEANLFQELANKVIYLDSSLRLPSGVLKQNKKNVSSLWTYGISGDNPIVLVKIDDIERLGIIKQLLRAHEYWGTKQLVVDLVILNEKSTSYFQELHDSLDKMVRASILTSGSYLPERKGKVYILQSQALSEEDQILLQTAARAVLNAKQGSLADQVRKLKKEKRTFYKKDRSYTLKRFLPLVKYNVPREQIPTLDFFNGIGGFTDGGKEYLIHLKKGESTPAPWINIVANPEFGFQVSESGAGFTWSLNSRENKITPWSNDPVCDSNGECFYIFDKDSGKLWSPTASPIRIEDAEYFIHHGQGYSRFEVQNEGVRSTLTQFVHKKESLKVSKLELTNCSNKRRDLSITGYVEWVLGFSRTTTVPYIITELEGSEAKVALASNPWSTDFGNRISFATFIGGNDFVTSDRTEFLGRNGSVKHPAFFINSESTGLGVDPCAAVQKEITLQTDQSITLFFILGQADSREKIEKILKEMEGGIQELYQDVINEWDDILTKVQIETPDLSMNILLNRWSLYQTVVCRLWARSAFYQSGGAFGFRDQLQDTMALVWSRPEITRAQIILAASRQFVEGDVQHWWHPPRGQGVRTHFSDDLLWLPFVVSYYTKNTGDLTILDELVPFLEGPTLQTHQESSYYVPVISKEVASLYEHCSRAIDHSLNVGAHGLPLMGGGDWNDGMNSVGIGGKGESVWLAWFLYSNLISFSSIANTRLGVCEKERSQKWRTDANNLITAIEKEAWDGAWYRRAFFDDGSPLGSSSNLECKIDSIAQTWAVISGATNHVSSGHEIKGHAEQAMKSVEEFLIKKSDDLVLLFSPPFDKTLLSPGYIKGYLPGVRENGGQYSHAAIWCIYAYAGLHQGKNAVELFSMLNPINHTSSHEKVSRYKVEPYVLAADVYSQATYVGRGGWTWYTGASAWMYRAGMESILGLSISGNKLKMEPNISPEWKSYKVYYKYRQTTYEIEVQNPKGLSSGVINMAVDGKMLSHDEDIALVNDGVKHVVIAELK